MGNQETPAVAGIASTKAFAALSHPHYRRYYIVGIIAMIADNVEHVIAYWMIYQKFHSPALGGLAVISHWLPSLLFSVYSGSLADRLDCRRLIQGAHAFYMLSSLSWGILFLTGSLQAWQAVVILLLHGVAGALNGPAQQLILHDMVGLEHLQSAIRLNASSRNLATLLGPALGGALLLLLGPALGMLVNVLNYLPLILVVGFLPYKGLHRESVPSQNLSSSGFQQFGPVCREARKDRRILFMILLGGATSLFVGNAFQAQMPEFAHRLGTDKTGLQYSALLAANAVGALLGALLLESTSYLRPRLRTALLCAALWSLAIGIFPLVPSYVLAMLFLLLAGFFNITFVSMAQILVQVLAPPAMRGRLVGLFQMANQGLRVGSGFTVGVLGSVVGVYWSLGLSAAAVLVIALGLLVYDIAAPRGGFSKP